MIDDGEMARVLQMEPKVIDDWIRSYDGGVGDD